MATGAATPYIPRPTRLPSLPYRRRASMPSTHRRRATPQSTTVGAPPSPTPPQPAPARENTAAVFPGSHYAADPPNRPPPSPPVTTAPASTARGDPASGLAPPAADDDRPGPGACGGGSEPPSGAVLNLCVPSISDPGGELVRSRLVSIS